MKARSSPRRLAITFAGVLAYLNLAHADTLYVWQDSPSPTPPYADWTTAATNIQDAVDAAQAGDEIVVTNGVYQTGAREVHGMSNRVAVTKAVAVRSVNGPEVTIIQGYQVPGAHRGCGAGAIRCMYLTNGAVLAGFTLRNGPRWRGERIILTTAGAFGASQRTRLSRTAS